MNEYTTNNLFAAEEWDVIFNAYRNISIKAFDYDTVMKAMNNYLMVNNPEEYDTIQKNGIMTIHMDMVARLSHSLSYRYEMTARENFFDTATLRESVIKLAKAFSYKPKRNRGASGLCRISGIRTNEPVVDSNGNDISDQTIRWNQAGDPNWQEKFYKILNLALTSTNPFGRPLKRESIYNTQHEVYALNRLNQGQATYPFSVNVRNTRYTFEVVSTDISNDMVFEDIPNPNRVMKLLYKNDRAGNFSPNTGFFVQIKQGELQSANILIDNARENRVIPLENTNINETDVWVLELNDDGSFKEEWQAVNNLYGQSVDYENIFNQNRKLYTIESLDENDVNLHFGDGIATEIPKGNFRIWYRTSMNERFSVKDEDIFEAPVQLSYVGDDGLTYQLTIFLTNTLEISNSEPEESVYRIKRNSPLAHYSQDRMINAEDYNIYPQTRTSIIKKQRTVNRTHPGHSRYMDIYDDSNEISYINLNSDDGYVFIDEQENEYRLDINANFNYENEILNLVDVITNDIEFVNYIYHSGVNDPIPVGGDILWNVLPSNLSGNMGYFSEDGIVQSVGNESDNEELVPIRTGTILTFEKDGEEFRTFVTMLENDGIVNPAIDTIANIQLGDDVMTDSTLVSLIPNIRNTLRDSEIQSFVEEMEDEKNFNIHYDYINNRYVLNSSSNTYLVASFVFNNSGYDITSPTVQFVLGSNNNVRFFYKPDSNLLDQDTLLPIQDSIEIEDSNVMNAQDSFIKRVDKSNDIVYLSP